MLGKAGEPPVVLRVSRRWCCGCVARGATAWALNALFARGSTTHTPPTGSRPEPRVAVPAASLPPPPPPPRREIPPPCGIAAVRHEHSGAHRPPSPCRPPSSARMGGRGRVPACPDAASRGPTHPLARRLGDGTGGASPPRRRTPPPKACVVCAPALPTHRRSEGGRAGGAGGRGRGGGGWATRRRPADSVSGARTRWPRRGAALGCWSGRAVAWAPRRPTAGCMHLACSSTPPVRTARSGQTRG
ncbi:hypothetical protein I4F81_003029 [Pyropia yezoensis]|uniref:Uncharacterized protein n=1 Tax=Pyropia yezoensis TaxID=2788 RepID=A0ACC3BR68_PYRYE|nr:hypothetical protein I4F81_003029 [Neopyropia yezoensis]